MVTPTSNEPSRVDLPWELSAIPVAMAGRTMNDPDNHDCGMMWKATFISAMNDLALVVGPVGGVVMESPEFAVVGVGGAVSNSVLFDLIRRQLPQLTYFHRYATFSNMMLPVEGTREMARGTLLACEDEIDGLKDSLKDKLGTKIGGQSLVPVQVKYSVLGDKLAVEDWGAAEWGGVVVGGVLIGYGFVAESTIIGAPEGLAMQGAGVMIIVIAIDDKKSEESERPEY